MPLITKDSYVWTDTGVKPTEGNESATPGEQPVAEHYNWSMWAITNDIDKLNTAAGSHSARHQAGGDDEIDLDGLDVGSGGSLTGSTNASGEGLLSLSTTGGSTVATLNTATQRWTKFPAINPQLTLYGGLQVAGGTLDVAGNITDGSTVIYDSSTNSLSEDAMPSGYATGDYVERSNPSVTATFNMGGNGLTEITEAHFASGSPSILGFDTTSANLNIRDRRTGTDVIGVNQNSVNVRRNTDYNGNEIRNFRVENRSNDPSSPAAGRMWLRTDL